MILAPYGQIPGSFPYGIGYAYGPSGPNGYLCPSDPQNNERGEAGLYYDTMLGGLRDRVDNKDSIIARIRRRMAVRGAAKQAERNLRGLGGSIPTDAELATVYGYTPVNSGWIASNQGFVTGPWIPPNGYQSAGAFGPPVALNGLRDAAPATPEDMLSVLNAHNEKMFTLAMVSTLIGGLAATLAIWRTVKSIRED